MQRRFTQRVLPSLLILLAASWPVAMEAQDRPFLSFGEGETTRTLDACEVAVVFNLVAPATSGDVREGCRCVDDAVLGASVAVPARYSENYIAALPDGREALQFAGILEEIYPSARIPEEVRVASRRLAMQIRDCLGSIPVRDLMFSGTIPVMNWAPPAPGHGPDLLADGAARARNLDEGGLFHASVEAAASAFSNWFIWADDADRPSAQRDRVAAAEYMNEFQPDQELRTKVWECRYRRGPRTQSQHYYFWYGPEWTPELQAHIDAAPADHPIRRIGPAAETCPIQEPLG